MAGTPDPIDVLSVETPESVAFAYRLAGLGSRGFALMLDTLLIGLIGLAEALVAGAVYLLIDNVSPESAAVVGPWLAGGLIVAIFITGWGYFIIGEVFGNGRTFGKRWMGLRVVREDGSRVRTGDSIIRNLLRVADILPGNYAVGMFSILFTRQHKRLGDMAAGTVVIRDETQELRLEDGGLDERVLLGREYLERRGTMVSDEARWQVGTSVLATFGEAPQPNWTEPIIAGRVAQLCSEPREQAVPLQE